MKKIFSKISSFLTILLILLSTLLLTIRLQLTNANFWNTVFDKADIYNKAQLALSYAAQNQIEKQLTDKGIDIESLSVGERAALFAQADMIREVATVDRLKEFTHENINRITDYTNGKSEELYLYTPFAEWGIKSSLNGEDKSSLMTSETNVQTIIKQGSNASVNQQNLLFFKNLIQRVNALLVIISAIIATLLIFNYKTSVKEIKLNSTANIMLTSGAITLFFSIILKYIGDNLVRSSPYIRDPLKILLSAFIPAFFSEITKMWVLSGIGILVIGLLLRMIAIIKSRRLKTAQSLKQPKYSLED